MSDELYQARIVALAKSKAGAGKLAAPTRSARRDNPLCGDRVTIDVTLAETTWAPPPRRFEAGTPPIGPAIGLGAACNWMAALDWTAAHDHEMGLVQRVLDGLQEIDGTQILGPASLQNRYPVVSFMLDGVHPHDVAQTLDWFGVAVRAGHHCAQPLMDRFDLDGTTRVSIAPYNDNSDIDALLTGVKHAANTLR